MYGFGDDRAPAADTVAMMEETLLEYIVDVVRPPHPHTHHDALTPGASSARPRRPGARRGCPSRTCGARSRAPRTRRSLRAWRSCCSCRRTSSVRARSSTTRTSPRTATTSGCMYYAGCANTERHCRETESDGEQLGAHIAYSDLVITPSAAPPLRISALPLRYGYTSDLPPAGSVPRFKELCYGLKLEGRLFLGARRWTVQVQCGRRAAELCGEGRP
jgi:hypothetical protein